MDLVVLLDSSSSVKAPNFQILRQFLSNLTLNFNVGPDAMQLAVTRYNRRIDDRFDLNDYLTKNDLLRQISRIPYNGGGTFTGRGLTYLADNKFTAAAGRRPGVAAIALVITDGRANDPVAAPAARLHEMATATRVIAIGVGPNVHEDELITIATAPASENVVLVPFDQLVDRATELINKACIVDTNECLLDNAGCDQLCVNSNVGFYCECEPGYTLGADLASCIDIDECANNNGACEVFCNNTAGSYECSCPEGQGLRNDGRSCDIDECANNNGGCSHTCTNTNGSYVCSIHYICLYVQVSGLTCDDFNECLDENGGCSHDCVDTSPGYRCECPTGMILGPDMETCETNECDNNNGGCEQICENTPGSYNCACPPGFGLRSDGKTCGIQYVDECQDGNAGCQQTCVNTLDGYRCECQAGSTLNADLHSCDDINECLVANGGCSHNCTNMAPGYECSCPENMILNSDGFTCSCQDINECAVNNAGCQYNCTNTDGSFVCSCPVGQGLHIDGRTCGKNRADVAIVVDSSSSVKFNNFQKMKSFTNSLFQSFKLGEDRVHAALVRYNRRVDERFGFADTNTKAEVQDAVDAMPYRGGGTKTGQAIQHVIDNTMKTANGARADAQKIVIVITDGRSQDDVLTPSIALRDSGAITFGIGIGAGVLENQIQEIAGDTSRAFIVDTFDQLSGVILNHVKQAVCYDVNECDTNN
uniref:VWFA domain-containing protein n=1 Tax=Ciona savignyi TaxID=51511 RepID=H2Y975_CIOSA